MKIAIFRTDPSTQDPVSYNSQELGLAKGFAELGNTVDIIIASSTDRYLENVLDGSEGNIRVIELPFRLIPYINEPVYSSFCNLLKRELYDYVQVNEEGNLASYLIARQCYKLGLRFGLYQGMYRVLPGRKWALYEAAHHKLFRPQLRSHSVGAFCKTSEAQKFLQSRGYRNTHVIPVGLDFTKFEDREDREWRRQLKIDANDQLVLYVGKLEDRRNPLFIAELAEKACADKHFVVVGEGPCQSELAERKRVKQLDNLHMVGKLRQNELPSLYEQADVFVLPSNYEIYGMVVAESLYFGTPVISTRTAGPADVIQEELHGCLLSDLDAAKWLKALSSYGISSRKPDRKSKLSSYAEERFDWTRIAQDYINSISL